MARTIISSPTTISVVAQPSPPVTEWLPARGAWAQVSLNRVDTSVSGDFPPRFPSSRNMGVGGISDNFSGAIWNPHYGVLGAWVLWGGGHSQTSLENTVWIWAADTRRWIRVTAPTYPGDVPASPDWVSGDSNADFSEPLRSYGELITAGAPAASHSRYHPCILPPGNGTGPAGALAIPYQSAFHLGGNTISAQGSQVRLLGGTVVTLGKLGFIRRVQLGFVHRLRWERVSRRQSKSLEASCRCFYVADDFANGLGQRRSVRTGPLRARPRSYCRISTGR